MRRLPLLFVLLFTLPVYAQDVKKLDSLKLALTKTKEDTNRVNLLVKISLEGLKTEVVDSVIDEADRAARLAKQLHFMPGLANALTAKAQAFNRKGDFSSSIRFFNDAYHIYDSLNRRASMMNVLNSIGNAYLGIDSLDKAGESYTNALTIAKDIHDTVFMAIIYFGKGNIELERGNYAAASAAFDVAYLWFKQKKHRNTFAALVALADCDRKSGNAERALQRLLSEEKTGVDNLYFKERLYFGIASCYKDLKQYRNAIAYYQKALDMDVAQRNFFDASGVAREMAETYELSGDLKNALRLQKMYIGFNDSVFDTKFTQQFAEFEGKFQNQKKLKEIELLNKNKELADAELKRRDAELSRSQLLRNFGIALALVFAGLLVLSYLGYRQKKRDNAIIAFEKKKSDDLLLNILPAETANELKQKGHADARGYDVVTVLFTDFKGFSAVSEKLSPQALVRELNECFTKFDEIISRYQIEKIKTIGDAYMAAGGIPKPDPGHAERVVMAALEMRDFIDQRKQQNPETGLEIRIGIHTGPVVAGIVGVRKFAYDIWGDTVNTASRMESSGEPGKVNVSHDTFKLLEEKFHFTFRGKIAAKGKGEIKMYFAEPLDQMNSCPVPLREEA